MKILKLSIYSFLLISLASCGSKSLNEKGAGEDPSNNKTVKVGKLTWMTENLNVDKFNNGELIPEAKTPEEWNKAFKEKKAAWCYYENSTENGKKYGKLYNWFAVADSTRGGIAPKGFHVPDKYELATLTEPYDDDSTLSGNKLKSKTGWNENLNGDNESGFNALPSGSRNSLGEFEFLGTDFFLWSKTGDSNGGSGIIINDMLRGNQESKGCGYSLRLVKD
jgi:uncharacterized protein (TIGR02145 family)